MNENAHKSAKTALKVYRTSAQVVLPVVEFAATAFVNKALKLIPVPEKHALFFKFGRWAFSVMFVSMLSQNLSKQVELGLKVTETTLDTLAGLSDPVIDNTQS